MAGMHSTFSRMMQPPGSQLQHSPSLMMHRNLWAQTGHVLAVTWSSFLLMYKTRSTGTSGQRQHTATAGRWMASYYALQITARQTCMS